MYNIFPKNTYYRILVYSSVLIVCFSMPIVIQAQFTVKGEIPQIHGRKKINTYRILDTIRLKDTTIFVDKIVHWTSFSSHNLSPNFLGKSLMTPVAWGVNRGGMLFGSIGGTFPQIYTTKPDLIFTAGISMGNPRIIGGLLMLNVNDVSMVNTLSCNIILNKHFSNGDAISIGGIHLLRSKLSDAGPSYYIVYSHTIQTLVSKTAEVSALQYSIGIGTGRFYTKSPADQTHGRGKYGTAVFANLSYELYKWMNVNVEWSGINLHAGVSVKPFYYLPFITMGVGDITRFSGDRIRFLVGIGYSYYLAKQK